MEVFPYSWSTYEEYGCLKLRIFGLNKNNESVFILIEDFQPYLYLELPYIQNLNWGEAKSKVQAISNKIDEICGKFKPVERKFELKKKLYYAKKHTDKLGNLEDNLYPFLKCYFKSSTDLKQFSYKMKIPLTVSGVGKIQLKTHESEANPVLQFMCMKNLKPASWFKFAGFKIDKEDDKTSSCAYEYIASWKNFIPVDKNIVASPIIMGFDIEVNSSNPNITPQVNMQEDKIFQISCVVCCNGDKEENYSKYILSLGKNKKGEYVDLLPEKVGEDIEIRMFDTEADLLMGFNEIINSVNPHIICGYNIFGFDIPYICGRTKLNAITSMFNQLSFVKGIPSKEVKIEWSSSAFKNQNFTYLDAPGRLWIDMLPIIQRDYKLENYKLKTVSDFFLGCVDPSTPILLWNGFTKLAKDIVVGDELIGDDGEKRTVKELCKGTDDMYEIKQNSSDSYIVNSEHTLTLKVSEHLSIYWSDLKLQWEVDYLDRNKMMIIKKSFPIKNFNFSKEIAYEEILKFTSTIDSNNIIDIKIKDYFNLQKSLRDKLKGFKSGIINWNKQDVPINPYIFGIWLGDGDGDGRGFTTNDKEILNKWEEWCNNNNSYVTHIKRYNYRIRDNSFKITGKRYASTFKNILRKYNLFNNKHIPSFYLINDKETRLQVLAGLIDTDGHVSGSEGVITQVRKELSENILYLVRSLGFSAKLKTRKTSWTWKNEKKYSITYEVRFSGNGIEDIPTILPHKKFQARRQKKDPLVTSISVKNIGKGDYVGWSLDGNKRFLLGDFTVTHNCTKDPLTHKGIFKCYRMFTPESLSIVGKYCVKDSELVVKLFEKLQIWIGLTEMSNTCNTPIFTLFTQGQQIKIFSQVYKKCMEDNFVIDKDSFIANENDHFTGAYVFTPVPGLYDMVVSFDFSSLYPSTIIAYNIDYSTLVLDEKIPDEKCHIFEWEDHFNCQCPDTKVVKAKKIVICKKNRFRFLKEPMGIIPTLLTNLIDARKKAKKEMEKLKEIVDEMKGEDKEQAERMITVFDKRQLAYKVSCNSMYGGMGVKRGYLPFLPGAMCTTARGRQSIEKAAKFLVENYRANLIYGDTDSCYISFPQFTTEKDAKNLDMFCRQVEEETSSLFPRPMKFAYEEAIYWRYLILSKKRYMALKCDINGKVKDKIEKRGVLLSRRDNSAFSREFYSKVIMKTFYKEKFETIVHTIRDEIDRLLIPTITEESQRISSNSLTAKDLSISKSIGDIKDYKIKPLPDETCLLCKNKVLTTFYCIEEHKEYNEKLKKCIKCNTKTPYFSKVARLLKNKEPQYCYSCKEEGMVDIVNKKLQKRLLDLKLLDPDANLPIVKEIFKDFVIDKNDDKVDDHRINNQLEYQIVEEYLNKALPSQMQLAQRMRKRGNFLTAGERLAYIVIESASTKDKLFDKIEDLDYFKENKKYINIDQLYYVKLMINPIDEVLMAAYNKEDIFKKIYKYKENYYKVMFQLKELFSPRIKLIF